MSALPKGIHRRGGAYVCTVSHRGQRRTATEATLEDAILRRRALQEDIGDRGVIKLRSTAPKPWTLRKAYDTTLQVAWSHSKAGRTAEYNARCALSYFGPIGP